MTWLPYIAKWSTGETEISWGESELEARLNTKLGDVADAELLSCVEIPAYYCGACGERLTLASDGAYESVETGACGCGAGEHEPDFSEACEAAFA